MLNKITLLGAVSLLFVGCATVPTNSNEITQQIKQFNTPQQGNAGLYIYRTNSVIGASLKKDIWIDGNCVGESARGIFFLKKSKGI